MIGKTPPNQRGRLFPIGRNASSATSAVAELANPPLRQQGPPRLVATPAISSIPDAQQGLAEQRRTTRGTWRRGGSVAPGARVGGFAALGALLRRVAPLLVQFPPFAGGEVAVRGGVAPKVQTTSAKNADNRLSWAKWSAFWAQRRLASRGAAREPLNMRVNPLIRTSTSRYARGRRCPRSHERVNVRMSGPTLALAGPGANQRAHVRAGALTPGRRGRARS